MLLLFEDIKFTARGGKQKLREPVTMMMWYTLDLVITH